eukprot:COSAG02_NODE_9281_length_2268_cov_3.037344_2_plen_76_part_00
MAKLQEHVQSRGADCMAGLGRAFRIVDRCVCHARLAWYAMRNVLTRSCAAVTIRVGSTAMSSSALCRSGAWTRKR